MVGNVTIRRARRDQATGATYGDVVDLLWTAPCDEIVDDMLRFALQRFASLTVPTATMWAAGGTHVRDAGARVGFVAVSREKYLCGRAIDAHYDGLMDGARWSVSPADSEEH